MRRNLVLASLIALILQLASAQAGDRKDVETVIPFAGPYTPHFPPYDTPYSTYGYYAPYYQPYGGLHPAPNPVNGAPPAAYMQPGQFYGQTFPFQMYGPQALGQTYGQPALGQMYGQPAAPLPAPQPPMTLVPKAD